MKSKQHIKEVKGNKTAAMIKNMSRAEIEFLVYNKYDSDANHDEAERYRTMKKDLETAREFLKIPGNEINESLRNTIREYIKEFLDENNLTEVYKWKPSKLFDPSIQAKYLTSILDLKKLQKMYDLTDLNNPNKKQRDDTEKLMKQIGFYGEDGEVGDPADYNHPLLKALSSWAEKYRT